MPGRGKKQQQNPNEPKNVDAWQSLAPWQQAQEWLTSAPDIAGDVMAEAKVALAHKRAMEVRSWRLQVATLAASLLIALVLAAVSWHGANAKHAATSIAAASGSTALTGGALTSGVLIRRRKSDAAGAR